MTPISQNRRSNLKRRRPSVTPKPRLLVLCEGEITEPSYLNHWKSEIKTPLVEIEIEPTGAVPKTLVEKAAARKKLAAKEASRRRDENLKYEEVWCVFDVDSHPHLADAKRQALDNGILIALSNPCFELWLTLHFQEQNAHLNRDDAKRLCEGHLRGYGKKITPKMFASLREGYDDAVQRCARLETMHTTAGRARDDNPSSSVGVLIERLISLGKK